MGTPRGQLIRRVALVDLALREVGGVTRDELARRIGCCERTVRRIVRWIEKETGQVVAGSGSGPVRRWSYAPGSAGVFTDQVAKWLV